MARTLHPPDGRHRRRRPARNQPKVGHPDARCGTRLAVSVSYREVKRRTTKVSLGPTGEASADGSAGCRAAHVSAPSEDFSMRHARTAVLAFLVVPIAGCGA